MRRYFILTRPAPTKKEPDRRKIEVYPVFAFQSSKGVDGQLRAEPGVQIVDYFWSNCQVAIAKEWEFKGEKYPADEYTLKTLWTQGNAVLKHGGRGLIGAKPETQCSDRNSHTRRSRHSTRTALG